MARLARGCPVLLSDRRAIPIQVATPCLERYCMPLASLHRGIERLAGEGRLSFYLSLLLSLYTGNKQVKLAFAPDFYRGQVAYVGIRAL
jgi:hypothetical protein